MITVMISGHFDPITDAHFDYIMQAWNYGNFMICVVASDAQTMLKKGRVNIPDIQRAEILGAILRGLGIRNQTVINWLDNDGTITNALKWWRPNVLVRGGDKTIADMPENERKVCEELAIRIEHSKFRIPRHSSEVVNG